MNADAADSAAAAVVALASVAPVLAAHAGGVELAGLEGGVARVRYTGMCTGCPLRPLTTVSTVRPALLAVAGVTVVEVEGSRISAEAEERLARALAGAPHTRYRADATDARTPLGPRPADEVGGTSIAASLPSSAVSDMFETDTVSDPR
jgi:Fe-S cluster biogenesis protein NfuA